MFPKRNQNPTGGEAIVNSSVQDHSLVVVSSDPRIYGRDGRTTRISPLPIRFADLQTGGRLWYDDRGMGGIEYNQVIRRYVEGSVGPGALASRTVTVMEQLPAAVLADFLNDPRFRLALDDHAPGQGRTVWIACPSLENGSRCVILKPRLADCPEDFAYYVIAHELAHAHLRNGGWGDLEDPELAADALAAYWGFSRPPQTIATTAV